MILKEYITSFQIS